MRRMGAGSSGDVRGCEADEAEKMEDISECVVLVDDVTP
jgi:hypothetical protein